MDTRKNPFFEFPAPSDRDSDCSSYLLPVFIHTSSKKHSFPKALPAHIWVSFGLNRAWKNFEMKKKCSCSSLFRKSLRVTGLLEDSGKTS